MNDIPIAVIKGASRGAPRKGRYATNSMLALITPHEIMEREIAAVMRFDSAPLLDLDGEAG